MKLNDIKDEKMTHFHDEIEEIKFERTPEITWGLVILSVLALVGLVMYVGAKLVAFMDTYAG